MSAAHLLPAGIAGLIATVAAAWTIGYPGRDLRQPLIYAGDELAGLGHVTGVDESGWWFVNPRLGAPFSLEHYDFPQGGDGLQVAIIRFLTLFTDDAVLVMNVYFLMTFLLVAMVSHWVMRHLGLAPLLAGALSILYALLPFHFWHGTPHIYRSGYFAAPLGCLVLFWLAGYRGGFWSQTGDRWRDIQIRWPRVAIAAVAVFVIGTTDTVAAAFAPALAGVIGIIALLRSRDPRILFAGLVFAVATIGTVIVANTGTLLYVAENGPNEQTVDREVNEQELYALKLSRVLLPSENHRFKPFASLGTKPMESRIASEGGQALGFLGVAGLVGGVITVLTSGFVVGRRDEVDADTPDDVAERDHLLGLSGVINIAAIVVSVPAGAAYVLSLAGFEEIRTWNRIVVYVGFFAFVGTGVLAARLFDWLRANGRGAFVVPIVVVATAFGIWDQTPKSVGDEERIDTLWTSDVAFFAEVEADLADDPDPMLYTLPNVVYPEPSRSIPIDYEHMRAILHSDRLEVSYGAMRGRPEHLWQPELERLPADVALDALAAIGFDGVYVDIWATPDGGARLAGILGTTDVTENGRNRLHPLGDRRGALEAVIGTDAVDAVAAEVLSPTRPVFGDGHHTPGPVTTAGTFGQDGAVIELERVGDGSSESHVVVDFLTSPGPGHTVELVHDGVVLGSGVSVDDRQLRLEAVLTVPEDGTELVVRTSGPEFQAPGDTRKIQYAITGVVVVGPATRALLDDVEADRAGLTLAG